MKRIIVLLGIMCLSVSAFAQKGYEGSVSASLRLSINTDERAYCVETIHGYRFNSHIFVGGGAGLEFASYDELMRLGTPQNYKEVKNLSEAIIPVFAVFKANFTEKRFSPFFMMKAGECIGPKDEDKVDVNQIFAEPVLGFDIYLGNRGSALSVFAGLNMRRNTNLLNWDLTKPDFVNSLRFGVGFKF